MEKWKKIKKIWLKYPLLIRLWLGCLLLVLILIETRAWLSHEDSSLDNYLAAKRKLLPGMHLTVHDLTGFSGNKSSINPSQTFTDQQLHEVVGSEVLVEIEKGKAIISPQIRLPSEERFSRRVPSGLRAYSIQVENPMPLQSGDKVDVLVTLSRQPEAEKKVIPNRKVLGARTQQGIQQVLIAVSASEATLLDKYHSEGNLSVILRNPEDEGVPPLVQSPIKRPANRHIEVWSEKNE